MFSFLHYISPTWYYNLETLNSTRYWPNVELLTADDRSMLDWPQGYSNSDIDLLDLAYQAWLKGIIVEDKDGLHRAPIRPNVSDEYRFVRRHFNPIWGFFVLFLRLIERNNPYLEAKAFFSTIATKRINPFIQTKDWIPQLKAFNSPLLAKEPKVSVIIPTLNRYKYLKDALHDLEKQNYANFEVLIVDQSDPFNKEFYSSFSLDLRIWYQEEKALWRARNDAVTRSDGEFVLLFDDDSRVGPDWITSHLRCLDYFGADISSGVSIAVIGGKVPPTYSYYKWGDQIDTGNVMLKKNIFCDIGLFDRQFEKQRQGDGEFGLRAHLAGYKNISNPDAKRLHLKVAEGGLREMGSWDGWRPKNLLAPRPIPSVLYLTRKYFGGRAALYEIAKSILPSVIPYRFKRNKNVMIWGTVFALLLIPFISISVFRSWRLASQKLREGALIPLMPRQTQASKTSYGQAQRFKANRE